MPKRTYQPKTHRRKKQHGFMKRMSDKAGKSIIRRRRIKARKKVSA
jgi:large subunit ribosomal protein L34